METEGSGLTHVWTSRQRDLVRALLRGFLVRSALAAPDVQRLRYNLRSTTLQLTTLEAELAQSGHPSAAASGKGGNKSPGLGSTSSPSNSQDGQDKPAGTEATGGEESVIRSRGFVASLIATLQQERAALVTQFVNRLERALAPTFILKSHLSQHPELRQLALATGVSGVYGDSGLGDESDPYAVLKGVPAIADTIVAVPKRSFKMPIRLETHVMLLAQVKRDLEAAQQIDRRNTQTRRSTESATVSKVTRKGRSNSTSSNPGSMDIQRIPSSKVSVCAAKPPVTVTASITGDPLTPPTPVLSQSPGRMHATSSHSTQASPSAVKPSSSQISHSSAGGSDHAKTPSISSIDDVLKTLALTSKKLSVPITVQNHVDESNYSLSPVASPNVAGAPSVASSSGSISVPASETQTAASSQRLTQILCDARLLQEALLGESDDDESDLLQEDFILNPQDANQPPQRLSSVSAGGTAGDKVHQLEKGEEAAVSRSTSDVGRSLASFRTAMESQFRRRTLPLNQQQQQQQLEELQQLKQELEHPLHVRTRSRGSVTTTADNSTDGALETPSPSYPATQKGPQPLSHTQSARVGSSEDSAVQPKAGEPSHKPNLTLSSTLPSPTALPTGLPPPSIIRRNKSVGHIDAPQLKAVAASSVLAANHSGSESKSGIKHLTVNVEQDGSSASKARLDNISPTSIPRPREVTPIPRVPTLTVPAAAESGQLSSKLPSPSALAGMSHSTFKPKDTQRSQFSKSAAASSSALARSATPTLPVSVTASSPLAVGDLMLDTSDNRPSSVSASVSGSTHRRSGSGIIPPGNLLRQESARKGASDKVEQPNNFRVHRVQVISESASSPSVSTNNSTPPSQQASPHVSSPNERGYSSASHPTHSHTATSTVRGISSVGISRSSSSASSGLASAAAAAFALRVKRQLASESPASSSSSTSAFEPHLTAQNVE